MKHLKHIFTALLLLCTTMATAHDFEVDGIYYKISSYTNNAVEVTYKGDSKYSANYTGSVVIPESITNNEITYSVIGIGYYAFRNCDSLTSIEIPNSVKNIRNEAFYGCAGLTSITIPNSVTSIGQSAFDGCYGLKEVHTNDIAAWCNISFGSSTSNPLCYAGNLYLNGRLVTNLTIPNSVRTIPSCAFYGCTGLTSVEIPSSVVLIGTEAFYGCSGLTSITIPNSVTSIEDWAFYGCTNLANIEIPNSVTSIGNYAFYNTTWYNKQPDGLVYAGKVLYKYKGTMPSNTSITIKDGTLGIADRAFINCDSLTSITIPSSVSSIGDYAFQKCTGLTSIVIPNSVTNIEQRAFYDCTGLTSVVIGNSVASIGNNAFYRCTRLKTIYNFSNLIFSIGSDGYGYIAYYADNVYNSPNVLIENVFIENDFVLGKVNGVNTLVGYFGNASEITLPADYNEENYVIGANVFIGNTTITSIEIPNSVTGIEACAFEGCNGLAAVHINDIAAWCGIDFGSADANPLYYAKNLYLNGELLTELSIPAEIAEVKDYAFYICNGVTIIDIVDGVKSIGSNAFYGCSNLETLYISNTIESIGDYAFAECNNILDIKIGSKKAITASENIFSSDAYNNACLYVPTGRKDFYAKTSPWSNFIIREMDFTGIEDVEAEGERVKDVYYDLSGRVVENPSSGIYIINGKKVIIK